MPRTSTEKHQSKSRKPKAANNERRQSRITYRLRNRQSSTVLPGTADMVMPNNDPKVTCIPPPINHAVATQHQTPDNTHAATQMPPLGVRRPLQREYACIWPPFSPLHKAHTPAMSGISAEESADEAGVDGTLPVLNLTSASALYLTAKCLEPLSNGYV